MENRANLDRRSPVGAPEGRYWPCNAGGEANAPHALVFDQFARRLARLMLRRMLGRRDRS